MSSELKTWFEEQLATSEDIRLYEEEHLVTWVTELLCGALEERNMSRAELARVLGTSRANITQILSGSRNMTLRSLADIAWACGFRAEVDLLPIEEQSGSSYEKQVWQTGDTPVLWCIYGDTKSDEIAANSLTTLVA